MGVGHERDAYIPRWRRLDAIPVGSAVGRAIDVAVERADDRDGHQRSWPKRLNPTRINIEGIRHGWVGECLRHLPGQTAVLRAIDDGGLVLIQPDDERLARTRRADVALAGVIDPGRLELVPRLRAVARVPDLSVDRAAERAGVAGDEKKSFPLADERERLGIWSVRQRALLPGITASHRTEEMRSGDERPDDRPRRRAQLSDRREDDRRRRRGR